LIDTQQQPNPPAVNKTKKEKQQDSHLFNVPVVVAFHLPELKISQLVEGHHIPISELVVHT
jgi:hypothetical protein